MCFSLSQFLSGAMQKWKWFAMHKTKTKKKTKWNTTRTHTQRKKKGKHRHDDDLNSQLTKCVKYSKCQCTLILFKLRTVHPNVNDSHWTPPKQIGDNDNLKWLKNCARCIRRIKKCKQLNSAQVYFYRVFVFICFLWWFDNKKKQDEVTIVKKHQGNTCAKEIFGEEWETKPELNLVCCYKTNS